jgi:hypothetical protein
MRGARKNNVSLLFNQALFALLLSNNSGQNGSGGSVSGLIGASLRLSAAAQVIANNTTTPVSFDVKEFDTSSFVGSLPATILTIPFTGLYFVNALVAWTSIIASAGSSRILELLLNGTQITSSNVSSVTVAGPSLALSWLGNLTAGNTLQLDVFQNSGASTNLTASTTTDATIFQCYGFH